MTKVTKKPWERRTATVKQIPKNKGKKKKTTLYQQRHKKSIKAPRTTVKVRRLLHESSRNKSRSYTTHSKKCKRSKRPTIFICCHTLNKKWSQNKKWTQDKKTNQNKKQNEHKGRGQNKKKNKNKRQV
uniref:Uncharacterized protein n=1 Tax=Sciurus vulgaris TaxID=55149 RepID=A0A8D2DYZ1_SCIVU